jgi:integrase
VNQFVAKLARECGLKRAERVLTGLKMMINAAVEDGLFPHNVALQVKVKLPRPPKLVVGVDVPSIDEARRIVAAAGSRSPRPRYRVRDSAAVALLVFGGPRAGELRGLQWPDLDLSSGGLTIQRRAGEKKGDFDRPKTLAGERIIPLPDLVIAALKEWRLASGQTTGLVFPGQRAAALNLASLTDTLGKAQIAAGITKRDSQGRTQPKYSPHKLRHFYASWLITVCRLPLMRVSRLLGHSSIRMTSDIYGHWLAENQAERAELSDHAAALLHPQNLHASRDASQASAL